MNFVRESVSEQLKSAIKPLHTGFVKESAPDQLQSVVKPFRKEIVKESASEQLQSVIKPFHSFSKGICKGKWCRPAPVCNQAFS